LGGRLGLLRQSGPQSAESQKYVIKILAVEELKKQKQDEIDKWAKKLEEILALQEKARSTAEKLKTELVVKNFHDTVDAIKPDQSKVRQETIALTGEMESDNLQVLRIRDVLIRLSLNEMASCIKTLEDLGKLDDLLYKETPLATLTKARMRLSASSNPFSSICRS